MPTNKLEIERGLAGKAMLKKCDLNLFSEGIEGRSVTNIIRQGIRFCRRIKFETDYELIIKLF